ncbi:HlyD family secretion protein [Alloprevotella rava]|uniref:HlyD family secretion protein n=1 Tax=Alloprevotella rava TaxID=671218 RepID=A0A7W5Y0W6_9BACT|nr:efflux RND transporter periplasmic adaptor subunit [Alloprevotella rava]MBB3701965.1 HlyD family secretion protein [Alloprevotella rava]
MATNNKGKVNLIPAILILLTVIILVVLASLYAFRNEDETLEGQADVTEYRVSSKVPGRIKKFYVTEGQYVHAGDTLAVLEAPEVTAKLEQAQAVENAAAAQSQKADNGARKEQIQGAYDMWQKAKVGVTIAEKSWARVKRLADEGVLPAQKLDEVTAQRDAAIATEKAAKSQYDMAVNGARIEDKEAARALVNQARGAIKEVSSYIKETYLLASADGEVTEIFPSVGELVGTGAPVMNVALMNDMWMTFNVREDNLKLFRMNQTVKVNIPALNKEVEAKVFYMKNLGSYATWKATKSTGQFDMKTFEVKVRPTKKVDGLRPGMSVLLK